MINTFAAVCCAFSIMILVTSGAKPALDDFISNIFDSFCGPNHVCVRHHQCNNGNVNRHGVKLVHPRIGNEPRESKSLLTNCSHYLEVCCDLANRNANPMVVIPKEQEQRGCGYRNEQGISLRILDEDNTVAAFAEFPWMMAIMKDEKYLCGGGLISESVVITVAHYVHNEPPYSLTVRAGEWDTQTIKEPLLHEDRIVARIIVHENYHDEDENLFYDIALLFLDHPFELKPNIQPICIPEPFTNFDYTRCYVTGWGKNRFGHVGQQSVILKKIDIPVIPHDLCQSQFRATSALGAYFDLHETFICAGGEAGRDACEGDGGSPLVCPIPGQPNRYQLAGLVAWGIECGLKDVPGAYVNIVQLRQWINDKLVLGGYDINLLDNINDIPGNPTLVQSDSSKINPTTTLKPTTSEPLQYDNGCANNEVCVRSFQCLNGKVNREGRRLLHKRIGDVGSNATVISKCEHYMDKCCDIRDYKKVQKTNVDNLESDGCGYRKDILSPPETINSAGANLSSFAEFPWMVAILKDDAFVCSGILLSDTVVVTLASCIFIYEPRQLMVRAGEWDTQTVKEPLPHEMRRAIKAIEHFNFVLGSNNDHNIAILILARPFELKIHINPICLPKIMDNFNFDECLISGWGQFFNVEIPFNLLKYSYWRPADNNPCKFKTDTKASKCMVYSFDPATSNPLACKSVDIGSPLICKIPNTNNRYQLAGILVQCGFDGTQRAEFTSIPFFNIWLSDKIASWFNGSLQLDIRSISRSSIH